MPGQAPPLLLAVTDAETGVWAVGLLCDEQTGALGVTSPTGHASGAPVSRAEDEDETWAVSAGESRLVVSPLSASEGGGICHVEGSASLDNQARPVSATGLLVELPTLGPGGSLRAAGASFGEQDALALSALRPAGAEGHDRDVLKASIFDQEVTTAAADPRLSATYDHDGTPLRVGLELWIAGEEEGSEYPRRASGESLGGELVLKAGGIVVRAYPMRWRSRSKTGFGPYVLGAWE